MVIIWDVLRVMTALAGLVVAAYQVKLAMDVPSRDQKARFMGAFTILLVISGTRIERIGDPPTWQLLASSMGVLLFVYGSVKFKKTTKGGE